MEYALFALPIQADQSDAARDFIRELGIDRKAARLRYLRDRWANRLAKNPKVKILHSPNPEMSAGIGMMGFNGVDGSKMSDTLRTKYNIFTVWMPHEEYVGGMRVTPNIYSTVAEVDYFADVMEKELKIA